MREVKEPLMIRIEPVWQKALKRLADEDGISVSEYIRRLIKRSVAQRGEA